MLCKETIFKLQLHASVKIDFFIHVQFCNNIKTVFNNVYHDISSRQHTKY